VEQAAAKARAQLAEKGFGGAQGGPPGVHSAVGERAERLRRPWRAAAASYPLAPIVRAPLPARDCQFDAAAVAERGLARRLLTGAVQEGGFGFGFTGGGGSGGGGGLGRSAQASAAGAHTPQSQSTAQSLAASLLRVGYTAAEQGAFVTVATDAAPARRKASDCFAPHSAKHWEDAAAAAERAKDPRAQFSEARKAKAAAKAAKKKGGKGGVQAVASASAPDLRIRRRL
jgi:hypothetical protein